MPIGKTGIVDNGSSHAGQASIDRMKQAWPHAELVPLPVHASWLSQVEIYFSILQRKAIKPGNLHRPGAPRRTRPGVPGQVQHHRRSWNYSRSDLNELLRRITDHQPAQAA